MNDIWSNGFLLLWPVGVSIAGLYAIVQSIIAWRNPDALFSKFGTAWYPAEASAKGWQRALGWTRERQQQNILWTNRFLAPVLAPIFIAVSVWMLVSAALPAVT